VTTTSDSYRQIKLWTQYHQSLGVGRFYLFVDGQARGRARSGGVARDVAPRREAASRRAGADCVRGAPQAARPEVAARLRTLPGVTVVLRDEALKHRQAHSRIWNETWLAAFFHKPCNHELFVLQSLNMEGAAPTAARGAAPLGSALRRPGEAAD